ncbi:MAG TPA: MraY family glycosyltransferase [Bryobacteraceae bacterium]|nr:MraY family glycosyltransferase [Bryobacteraceae bacterium]
MFALIVVALCSLLVSFFLTPFFRDFFGFLEVVDRPNAERKIHVRPVPRVGGIPLVVSYFLAAVALLALGGQWRAMFNWQDPSIQLMVRLMPAVVLIFATGLYDDIKGLSPGRKLAGQFAAASYACWAGVRLDTPQGYSPILIALVSVLWLVFCANAINLIDGIDGLAAGVALLASVSLLMASLLHHHPGLALTMAPLVGGLLGFLCYNFNPASVFLGDSGSLLCGFLLGCAGLMWNRHAATGLGRAAPLVALAFPTAEVLLSISRRFLRNRPIFGADRNHIHHRILSMGFSQRSAALILYGASAMAALFAVLQTILRPQLATVMLAFLAAAAYAGFRCLKYSEFKVFSRFVFAGQFRTALRTQIHLKEYEECLAAATNVEECWVALRDTCRQAEFSYVALRVGGDWFEERLPQHEPREASSRLQVPLLPSGSITFGRDPKKSELGMLIGPFAGALQAKLVTFASTRLRVEQTERFNARTAVAG